MLLLLTITGNFIFSWFSIGGGPTINQPEFTEHEVDVKTWIYKDGEFELEDFGGNEILFKTPHIEILQFGDKYRVSEVYAPVVQYYIIEITSLFDVSDFARTPSVFFNPRIVLDSLVSDINFLDVRWIISDTRFDTLPALSAYNILAPGQLGSNIISNNVAYVIENDETVAFRSFIYLRVIVDATELVDYLEKYEGMFPGGTASNELTISVGFRTNPFR